MSQKLACWISHSTKASFVVSLVAVALGVIANERLSAGLSSNILLETETLPEFSLDEPRPVYSSDPKDPWNRIFNLLFTRRIKVRFSEEFPEAAPFTIFRNSDISPSQKLKVSTRVFERFEDGDRAIDPLYPSAFTSAGALQILKEPNYSQLELALNDALNERGIREPAARALMQSDAWAAYDVLYRAHKGLRDSAQFIARKDRLLSLLAALIRKTALSRQENKSIPQNCLIAGQQNGETKFFEPNSGWIEVEFMPQRLHDDAVNFRRAARVFVKPIGTLADKLQFVQSLREYSISVARTMPENLDAVALVTQNLLVDPQGEIVTSPLIQNVQIRKFLRDDKGKLIGTKLREYELSRRKLLSLPSSGGFIELSEHSSTFKAAFGNDYGFATPFPFGNARVPDNPPLMIKLRSRCTDCHGTNQTFLMSFAVHDFFVGRVENIPRVKILNIEQDEHVTYVINRKVSRTDFKRLRQRFGV